MSRLVIVGAGGFGREVYAWASTSPNFMDRENIDEIVYLNDIAPKIGVSATIISSIGAYAPVDDDRLICAIGSPGDRQSVVESLVARGARFATLVHESAILGPNVTLGAGSVICPNVTITTDVIVGEHAQINLSCTIGHDVRIGNFVTLSPGCALSGGVSAHDGAFFGTGAVVIPGKMIGSNAVVGAGSVVVKNVAADTTVFGNPAMPYQRKVR